MDNNLNHTDKNLSGISSNLLNDIVTDTECFKSDQDFNYLLDDTSSNDSWIVSKVKSNFNPNIYANSKKINIKKRNFTSRNSQNFIDLADDDSRSSNCSLVTKFKKKIKLEHDSGLDDSYTLSFSEAEDIKNNSW